MWSHGSSGGHLWVHVILRVKRGTGAGKSPPRVFRLRLRTTYFVSPVASSVKGKYEPYLSLGSVASGVFPARHKHWESGSNVLVIVEAGVSSPRLLLFSCSVVSSSLWPQGLHHARLPCPSLSPRVCSNSCPLSRWCHPAISFSVAPFSSCLQSFLASGSFPEPALHIFVFGREMAETEWGVSFLFHDRTKELQ